MNIENKKNEKPFTLKWLDPRDNKTNHAGVGFYNEEYGEYYLRIDEEPNCKKYYLKPVGSKDETINYSLDLVLKKTNGAYIGRKQVGTGLKDKSTDGNIYVDYGSKFKTLVLILENQ